MISPYQDAARYDDADIDPLERDDAPDGDDIGEGFTAYHASLDLAEPSTQDDEERKPERVRGRILRRAA